VSAVLVHLAVLALVIFDTLVRAWRIRLLLPPGKRPSTWQGVVANAYGDLASAVTPARLGGEPARFLGLRSAVSDSGAIIVALGAELIVDWILLGLASAILVATLAPQGLGGVRLLAARMIDRDLFPWFLGVSVLLLFTIVGVQLYRQRHPDAFHQSARDAWAAARTMSLQVLGGAGVLTALSMTSRVMILPLLAHAFHVEAGLGPVVLGSFALLYSQLVLPTPAGAGGVELGFVAGFGGAVPGAQLAGLLLTWRAYTLVLGAALGAWFLIRSNARRLFA